MGLPIWREPTTDDSQLKSDPTAHDRSAIRRRRRSRNTARNTARLRREETTRGHETEHPSIHPNDWISLPREGLPLPRGYARGPGGEIVRNSDRANGFARPRSRRGPASGDDDLMPPLRRMGRRRVADEMTQAQEPDPQLFGTTLPDVSSTRPINGLGDRQRSWSPVDDVDAWNVLGSTITPDPSLPSASNSFATEVGTSFASSSRGYNRPRTTRAERPTITRSGAVPDPPEAHRGPWWTQHGTLASGADHTVHEIGEEPEEYFDARMNRPLLSNEESATARGINLDRRLSSFGRQQNLMRGNQEAVGSEQHPSRPTEAAGLRQTEMDYCPHDTVREVEDGNAPTTGERDDDSSSTTSSDSLDSYDEGTSGRNYRPEVVNQLDMELVRECDGFLEGLRQLISSNNRLTGDVHGIREGLRGLRRMVDTAAARTPHGGDAAASNGEMSGAVA